MATLINGNGFQGVTAQKDADMYGGFTGGVTGRLRAGRMMEAAIVGNTPRIYDGVILTKEGRRIQIDYGSYDDFTIPAGSDGVTSYFLIGYKLTQAGDGTQTCSKFVQATTSTGTIQEDELRDGNTEVYISLYRVTQSGTANTIGDCLLPVFAPLETMGAGGDLVTYESTWKGLNVKVSVLRHKAVFVAVNGTTNARLSTSLRWDTIATMAGIAPAQTIEGFAIINQLFFAKYRWTTQGVFQLGYSYSTSGANATSLAEGLTINFNFAFTI